MYTIVKRAGAFVSLSITGAMVAIAVVFASSFLFNMGTPECHLKIWSPATNSVRFVPNINLEKEFHFNTKEIFLYLYQESPEITQEKNEKVGSIIWDVRIVRDSKKKFVHELQNKYPVRFPPKGSTFYLRGCFIPYAGVIKYRTFATAKL